MAEREKAEPTFAPVRTDPHIPRKSSNLQRMLSAPVRKNPLQSASTGKTAGKTGKTKRANMATTLHQLTARKAETAPPGFHSDGGNLYLRVRDSHSRAWVFRFKVAGKVREIGLGPLHTRSLA